VVRIQGIAYPVTQCFVDCRAEGFVTTGDRNNFSTEKAHASNVGSLALHVNGTHVDNAGQAEPGTRRGAGDAVLTRTGLSDDSLGPQALCQQGLTDRVVDLVRTRVRQILALQPDLRTPAFRKPCGIGQCRGPANP